ncbi:MAG TPA: DUF1801 domain-containing protein [Burkholderiales bacterium]|nr:DUF1801 domain-containing protein [Burkholderiales bacterium]
MKDESQAIGGYLARVPEARRERALALHGLILSLFPQAEVSLEQRMPTYRLGEEWIAWASQKGHLALYTCAEDRVAGFRARHPEVDAGEGCLRFRDSQRLPLADLAQVVRRALAPELARRRR